MLPIGVTVEPMETNNTVEIISAEVQLPSSTAPSTPPNI